jgi:deoxyribonuclease V
MRLRSLHRWDVSPREAIEIQRKLAARVIRHGSPCRVRHVAGVDISVDRVKALGTGAVAVLSFPDLDLVEVAVATSPLTFPYVPGLLSFRETPVLAGALAQVQTPFDLLLVDGQGYAHPRRFGIACHLGLLLDVPTIGCAKSRLIGECAMPGVERGQKTDLFDKGQKIGSVLRTRSSVSPLYISVGHCIGQRQAEEWVLRCCRGYRLPQPARFAHQAAGGALTA